MVLILTTSKFCNLGNFAFFDNCNIDYSKSFYDGQNLEIVQENVPFHNNWKCLGNGSLTKLKFEAYSESSQTTKMELFEVIVNV